MDIIEPVEGPTPRFCPVVVVPKQNDELSLSVSSLGNDTRYLRAVDEVLQNLNQSTVFSKLDLK